MDPKDEKIEEGCPFGDDCLFDRVLRMIAGEKAKPEEPTPPAPAEDEKK